jgi:hypothetical protein
MFLWGKLALDRELNATVAAHAGLRPLRLVRQARVAVMPSLRLVTSAPQRAGADDAPLGQRENVVVA